EPTVAWPRPLSIWRRKEADCPPCCTTPSTYSLQAIMSRHPAMQLWLGHRKCQKGKELQRKDSKVSDRAYFKRFGEGHHGNKAMKSHLMKISLIC
ncbi:hypothetical protein CYMTET_51956, partial [Cymbomonas tetramitiformis]